MASHDFIPSPDDQFATFIKLLNSAVNDAANPLKLSTGQIADFNAAYALWIAGWNAWEAIANEVKTKLTAKDDGRAAVETVADTAKTAAGLPLHKETRTPVGEIESSPMLVRVDNEHLLQRLWFADSKTPGSKAKPAGAAFCEIRQQIVAAGAPAPTDPNAMPFLATDTKTPHRNDFDAADVGKTAYYAFRWTNTRAQPGPWSEISGNLIN